MTEKTAYNSTYAIGGVQCSADTFVVNQSLVLRIKICGENRHLRQAANRYKFSKANKEKTSLYSIRKGMIY